jgi:hypothetical protein
MLFKRDHPAPSTLMVSNTMVFEISRLLGRASRDTAHDRRRIIDLLSFIDAFVLYDGLVTLPASLPEDEDGHEERLAFREQLINQRLLRVIDPGERSGRVGELIYRQLRSVEARHRAGEKEGQPIEHWPEEEVRGLLGLSSGAAGVRGFEQIDENWVDSGGGPWQDVVDAGSADNAYSAVVGWMKYSGSGAYETSASWLRTFFYIAMSEQFHLPFWPEYNRVKVYQQYPSYLADNVRLSLYNAVAKSLRDSVANVFEEFDARAIYVPPFASLVLERATSAEDIPRRMFEVRDEYARLRRDIGELEGEYHSKRKISERLRVRKRIDQLMLESARTFSTVSVIGVEQIARYIPDVIKAAIDVKDLASLIIDLSAKGGAELARWWRNRPISRYFHAASKIKQIKDYARLIERHFGAGVAEDLRYLRSL